MLKHSKCDLNFNCNLVTRNWLFVYMYVCISLRAWHASIKANVKSADQLFNIALTLAWSGQELMSSEDESEAPLTAVSLKGLCCGMAPRFPQIVVLCSQHPAWFLITLLEIWKSFYLRYNLLKLLKFLCKY